MATYIVMPQMGESIAEGTITRWLKKVGDHVDRDEPLFEISTDKIDAEIPSPAEGTLTEVRYEEGDTVEVNAVVAVLDGVGFIYPPQPSPGPDLVSTEITIVRPAKASPDAQENRTSILADPRFGEGETIPKESSSSAEVVDWGDIRTDLVFTNSVIPPRVAPKFLPPGPGDTQRVGPSTIEAITGSAAREATDVGVFPLETILSSRYRIKSHLDQGGFGNIYLAVDIEDYFEDEIILKVPIKDENPDILARRLKSQYKEWKVLSEKNPDQVVKLLGVKRLAANDRTIVGVLMEYMAGGNLLNMVKTKWAGSPRTQDQLASLMRLFLQVCRSIHLLHANKLLHRDIKPANMLLDATQSKCKISDFELIVHEEQSDQITDIMGTVPYMAPECFEGRYSIASDIFSLGATLYQLLSGKYPFGPASLRAMQPLEISLIRPIPSGESPSTFSSNRRLTKPQDLTGLNALVSPELSQIVMRCLNPDPEQRSSSTHDLIKDLERLGLTNEGANTAPLNFARLLIAHLSDEDKDYLVKSLERSGFRSARELKIHKQEDLIEEYCYIAPPHEVLAHNCTNRSLALLAESVGLNPQGSTSRDELIDDIFGALGFLSGPRQVPGVEKTRAFVEDLLLNIGNTTAIDECVGMAHSGISAVERTIDLLVRFYGQLLYGSGFDSVLSRLAGGKPSHLLTFGQKVSALREFCSKPPSVPLSERIRQVFHWPILGPEILERVQELLNYRNQLAHQTEFNSFHAAQRFGRHALTLAVEIVTALAANSYIPRVVQITSRQDDVYGRHFYFGQDDRGRSERIFTPLPLEVGQLYLFFPLTNPARINPLIFPYNK
jgi:serine/threonine protein kinase